MPNKNLMFTGLMILSAVLGAVELDFSDSGSHLTPDCRFTLRGSHTTLAPEGLRIATADLKSPSGATAAKKYPALIPDGAFEFEAEFALIPEIHQMRQKGRFFLWDTRYSINTKPNSSGKIPGGFMIYLERTGKTYKATVLMGLAGNRSDQFSVGSLPAGDGKFHTLKLKFDPSGWQEIYFDGVLKQKIKTRSGKIAPSSYPATAGDRYGSIFGPLGGIIRRIRIEKTEPLKLAAVDFIARKYGSRRVFLRREKNAVMTAEFTNTSKSDLAGTVSGTVKGLAFSCKKDFQAKAEQKSRVTLPVETNLMPGKYILELKFSAADGTPLGKGELNFTIVPEFTETLHLQASDHFFTPELMDKVRSLGITHVHNILSVRNGRLTPHLADRAVESLDMHLEHGLRCDDKTKITLRFAKSGKYLLVDSGGKPYRRRSIDAAEEEVYREAVKAVKDAAEAFGNHPAWDRIYTNNELRDGSAVTFTETTRKHLKADTGLDIPSGVSGRLPQVYSAHPKMPWNRIVPVSDPEYRFWRWFWLKGDGWDKLNGDVGDIAVKTSGRPEFQSDFAPATRALPYLGTGGKVSILSTWTYNDPEPMKLGQTADELLALADGKKKIAIGNQGIWYRSRTAPANVKVKNPPRWLKEEPDAQYISPAPDMLREAFWIAVSRKICHLDTHGQGAWLRKMPDHRYRYTNPDITAVYPEFMNRVGKPLGPVLIKADETTPEVMILESFTNALYGGGHTWGWGDGWTADLHLALQWAQIQPGICYEEHLLRGDLDNGRIKVLVLPSCRVLSDRLLAKILDLQQKGVSVLADEFLNIALMPDFRIGAVIRNKADARQSKLALQKLGKEIREKLTPVLTPCFSASSQDLILRRRSSGEAQYLFAVNDRRTYGDYVGQWKRVMEKGLPLKASFSAALPCGAVYDLVDHRPMPFVFKDGKTEFQLDLKPGSGSIIVLLPRPIERIELTAPDCIRRGENYRIKAAVTDSSGKPFHAVLPLEIRFTANGKELPGSGFYATEKNGAMVLDDRAALNLPEGKAELTVKCLSSGKTVSREITIY
ncbi:MAG: hypothetical protein IKO93_06910 [Lentisphaeria bacterium]|nr:hypothetical protein [Lentisphaeria bacterium]